jgi:hypothetical protein
MNINNDEQTHSNPSAQHCNAKLKLPTRTGQRSQQNLNQHTPRSGGGF